MAAGAELYGFQGQILGISIDEPETILKERVAKLAAQVCTQIGQPKTFKSDQILVNDQYLGEGYGVMGEPEREAIQIFAQHEGLLLDPVYTGRAAAGLIDLIRKSFFSPDQTVLFWHTGGTSGLFAWSDCLGSDALRS